MGLENLNQIFYPVSITNEFKRLVFHHMGYNPYPLQEVYHFSKRRHKTFVGGARSGKTIAEGGEAMPVLLIPGTRLWLVGPTFELAEKEFRYVYNFMHRLLESDSPFAKEIEIIDEANKVEQGKMYIKTSIGSEIRVKSAVRPEGMLGEEIDWCGLCEASKLGRDSVFRYLRPRLTTRKGALCNNSTPSGHNWFSDFQTTHKDNPKYLFLGPYPSIICPYVDPEEVEEARLDMIDTPNLFSEQYLAKFVALSGLVYSSFNEINNVVDIIPSESSENLKRETAIGIHFSVPENESAIIVLHSMNNKLYVDDEVFGRMNLTTFTQKLHVLSSKYPEAVIIIHRDNDLKSYFAKRDFNIISTFDIEERAQYLEIDQGFSSNNIVIHKRNINLIIGLNKFQREEPKKDNLDLPSIAQEIKGVAAPKAFSWAAFYLMFNCPFDEPE